MIEQLFLGAAQRRNVYLGAFASLREIKVNIFLLTQIHTVSKTNTACIKNELVRIYQTAIIL
jgi:hypothetical protein